MEGYVLRIHSLNCCLSAAVFIFLSYVYFNSLGLGIFCSCTLYDVVSFNDSRIICSNFSTVFVFIVFICIFLTIYLFLVAFGLLDQPFAEMTPDKFFPMLYLICHMEQIL